MKTFYLLTNLWRKVKAISDVQSRDKERTSGRVNPRIGSGTDRQWLGNEPTKFFRQYSRVAAVICLLATVGVGISWGTVHTYDFTTVNNFYTTAGGNTHPGYTSSSNKFPASTSFYASDGACFTVLAASKVYFNSGYIMVGNTQPILQLPTYPNEKITQIKIWNSSGCSTSVKVAIKSGTNTASAQQTWSKTNTTYTYAIADSYQATTLKMDVTSANAQITKMEITTITVCNNTQLDIPDVTATPLSGQVQLTWSAVANATKYQVSWNGGPFADATSPFTKTSLTNGTSYKWAVKAVGNGSTYCDSEVNEGSTKPGSTIYTITWKVYGESDKTTKVASGDHLVLPASPSSCEVGKVFAGWSTIDIGGTPTDTKPTFVSSQTTISSNQTYYAVFATRTANSYTKGNINDLFPGQTVLIVNESNAKALSDEYVSGYQNKELQSVAVDISSSKITSMSNSHLIWTVENRGQKFNFKTGTGYLLATGAGNNKLACGGGADLWTLTSASDNKYYMNSYNSGTERLQYYSSYFTTYTTNTTDAYKMSFFVPTNTQYFTSCASCTEDPTIGAASITNDPFVLTSLTGTITVNCSGGSTGSDNCTWADRGYVWSLGTATTTPTVSNNKVAGTNGDKATGWAGWITPSGSTTPTAWEVGKTYYIRAYGKNGKDGATFAYGKAASFTLRSITFHSNGGTSVGPWYVNSGGTYEAPTAPTKDGYVFGGWYTDDGTFENPVDWSAAVSENKDYYARWFTYGDYVFSCAELTLEPHLVTAGTPIFITSAAGKKVRSQDSIHIEGSGLTPSTTLTFPGLPSTFEIKTATYGDLATNGDGAIDAAAYIFYTPAADATSDGLDKITGITVTVGGAKTKTVSLTQDIIGRHLPADFVIAGKKDGKWYALPDTMTMTTHPTPIEIAVDDANNPSVAYTAATNIYNLYGQNSGAGYLEEAGQYVKLGMKNNSTFANYPLLGTALTAIGKSTGTDPTHNLDKQYWWLFTQTNTSITNPQDAKYIVHCANNSSSLSIKNDPFQWGLYASGVEELRLIPASSIVFTEAAVVEWSQNGAILEVDATATTGIDATSVIAHLNGASSSAITLSETRTSVNGSATKYNYTVNFGIGIDFAAAASNGAMMTLEWKKGETVKAMSNIVVPKIIATSTSMSSLIATDDPWNTADVHVLPGVTLTANAGDFLNKDVVVDRLEIYPGATVIVTKGAQDIGTLKVRTLVLRNGWTRIGEKTYDVARLYVSSDANLAKNANENVWYTDWYIDFDQYYPIAVPWEVDLSSNDGSKIWYKNTKSKAIIGATTGSVRLRYYDGASRASNGQTNIGNSPNWKLYGDVGCNPIPVKLEPGKAYAMTAKRPTGKAFSIVRMPLTIPSAAWTTGGEQGEVSGTHKDQVSVTAHGDDNTPAYAKGWNFIANPYMSIYQGPITHSEGSDYNIEYVNIPDTEFKEYAQYPVGTNQRKLLPASGFLIQTDKDGVLTFGTTNRQASAPSYRNESTTATYSKQKAYIVLTDEQTEDMMGILVSEKYTADYELNADLEKLLSDGNTLRTYMRYNDMNMAYLAINEELAKQLIPVSVRIPADGEYTFRIHEASIADELEGIYLTDYQTNTVTNLLYDSYTFNAVAGTDNARFAINAVIGKREVPTGVDISGSDKDRPTKFIWNDKVYILHNNVIYDSTGKRVNVINK